MPSVRPFVVLAAFLLAGCHLTPFQPGGPLRDAPEAEPMQGAPSRHYFRVSQFVFLHDFELDRKHPLFQELAQLREQVFQELQLPVSHQLIQVYLFEDQEKYERFMKLRYPYLPKRRAFFVGQQRRQGSQEDLLVFTYWSDRIHQDLRHELTHALLHSVVKNVPLWLDEGLAEFFENPPGWNGINVQHLEQLRAGPVRFDLARLEQMGDVQQMTHAEYREAWAWTHLMMRGAPQGKKVLLSYLQELRKQPTAKPEPFAPRLAKAYLSLDTALERHLAELEKQRPRK